MGQTNRVYPVVEVALSCTAHAPLDSGHERKLTGDIIAVRPPNMGIGLMEGHRYLWLRLDSWEEEQTGQLTMSVQEGDVAYEKRRYQIPLERLKAIVPAFDVDRALDPTDPYQPFLSVDLETGLFLSAAPPLDIHGLVLDVVTGEYL